YIRERATDIGEVKRRLLDVLANMNPSLQCTGFGHCRRGKDRIVVAEELTPSLTVDLDTEHTKAFVTERGGPGSHAAILARALAIPAVSSIRNIHSMISCGTEALIDGDKGEVYVWPSEKTLGRYPALQKTAHSAIEPVAPVPELVVMANISRHADAQPAVAMQAEGIGLYRTEFEFFAANRWLSEDEQYERYARVVEALNPHPVTFRLLDIGGDKSLPYMDLPNEENPYLGFRGSRLLLDRADLFNPQARAVARAAAHGAVRVMYPMVVDVDQFRKLRRAFEKATADMDPPDIAQGVMFEVPSACLQARELLAEADFGSIGTNDLVQYLFAVDRNNDRVAYDYVPDRPVLWRLLETLVKASEDAGKDLSLCGEMATDPRYLKRLIECGIRAVSVSTRMIPQVRMMARGRLDPPLPR
ncbi:MAG TPA: phosphoenolpyruvate--protein phosphotransferase, partial [Candidatus Hydrogenedentes bacterium]|nr:phosphoenolpyruvate--protein phosphotransferase [Candidatus Hydrogenedentota bacterium]